MDIEKTDNGTIENWTPKEVSDAYRKGDIILIDVRTPQEYMFEHIDGALLSPMAFFNAANLPEEGGKPLVFHCGSGVRSKRVAQSLLNAGHKTVRHMAGGFAAWKQAGLTYRGTNMATGAPEQVTPQS